MQLQLPPGFNIVGEEKKDKTVNAKLKLPKGFHLVDSDNEAALNLPIGFNLPDQPTQPSPIEEQIAPLPDLQTASSGVATENLSTPSDAPIVEQETPEVIQALASGFKQSSGGLVAGFEPSSFEPQNKIQKLAQMAGAVAGDVPAMIVGAIVGGSGGPVTAAGGAFALPSAIRKVYMDLLEKGQVKIFSRDFIDRFTGALGETLKGEALGVTVGAAGKFAPKGFKTAGEVTALGAGGAAIEGRVPELEDFEDAAILVVGFKGSVKAAKKLKEIYIETGTAPKDAIKDEKLISEIKGEAKLDPDIIVEPPLKGKELEAAKVKLQEKFSPIDKTQKVKRDVQELEVKEVKKEVSGVKTYGIFDQKNPPKGEVISAIKLDSGEIIYDKEAKIHVDIINNRNIPPDKVVGSGFIQEGKYVEGGGDAIRAGEQARAKKRVQEKRARQLGKTTIREKGRDLATKEAELPGVRPVNKPIEVHAGLDPTSTVDKVLVGKPRNQIDATSRKIVQKNFTDIGVERVRTARFAKKVREDIPTKELDEVIYYIEKTGNPKVKGDTFEALSKRLSTKTKNFVNGIGKQRFDKAFNKMVEAGLLDETSYLESYITHVYKSKGVGAELKKFFGSKVTTRVPFKNRKIPTFNEAFTKHGLEPKGSFADILEIYENIANKAIINNTMLKELKIMKVEAEVKGKSGEFSNKQVPAIMRIDVARKLGIEIGKPNDFTPKGGAWAHVDSPALRRFKVSGKTGKVGVAVHPDVAFAMRQVFQNLDNIPYALELVNGLAKTAEVSFSAFHGFALIPESGTAVGRGFGIPFVGKSTGILKPIQTIKNGLKRLEEDPVHAELMAKARVNVSDAKEIDLNVGKVNEFLESVEKSLENVPIISPIFKGVVRLKKLNDKFLWDVVHRGIKSELFYRTYTKELIDNPGVHPDVIAKKVGAFINDAFGGLDWNTMWNISPKAQQYMRLLMFSPDWTLAQIRVAGKVFSADPLTKKLHFRYMARMVVAYELFHEGINYAITGHSTFENDPGHEGEIELPWKGKDGRKRYIHAGKQIREILRWFTNPLEQAGNKLSPVASELFLQVSGATAGGQFPAEFKDKEGFEETKLRLKSAASRFRPFSLSGGNFALTLPQRKGTSFFRSTRDIARKLRTSKDLWENPFSPSVVRLLKAAEANGHDPHDVLMRAKGEVNRELYKEFFDAWEAGNFDKINKTAEKISEYGLVTEKGLKRSLSVRGLDKKAVKEALSAFSKHGFVTKNEILKKYGLEVKKKKTKTVVIQVPLHPLPSGKPLKPLQGLLTKTMQK